MKDDESSSSENSEVESEASFNKIRGKMRDDESSESSEVEWEEVTEGDKPESEAYSIPRQGVEIVIPDPNAQKIQDDRDSYFMRLVNNERREKQIELHKASLLCLISRGIQLNELLRSETLFALALSVLEKRQTIAPKNLDMGYITSFITWFTKVFLADETQFPNFDADDISKMEINIMAEIEKKRAFNLNHLYFLFLIILRGLGVEARLVISLQPISKKVNFEDLMRKPRSQEHENLHQEKLAKNELRVTIKRRKRDISNENGDPVPSTSKTGQKAMDKKSKTMIVKEMVMKAKKTVKKSGTTLNVNEKSPNKERFKGEEKDKEIQVKKKKTPQDIWVEVYLEAEEIWASVKLDDGKIMVDNLMEARATQPISYVIAFDNFGDVKDVTRRYAKDWLTQTQRLRIESSWWERSLRPFIRFRGWKSKREDELLDDSVLNSSFPTSLSGFRMHPFYILSRHLLKNEAIYPPDVKHVGLFKGERIYSRENVKELRTRKAWYNLAKVVKKKETPFKIVEVNPNSQETIRHPDYGSKTIELFGEWQVENFNPPVAVDGRVPRNEYGNVELFQPQMLPIGTSHLTHPGINLIAKKLGIDCAPAIFGFEYAYGKCRPIQNGHVVCMEFQELLIDAWREDKQNSSRKLEEKKSKRARANWKKLIRAVFIRKRLEAKYGLDLGKRRLSTSESSDCETNLPQKRSHGSFPSMKKRTRKRRK